MFTEELFSPLEAVRAFPIIESSEMLGGVVAGLTMALLSGVIPMHKIIYIWIIIIAVIIPILLLFKGRKKSFPKFSSKSKTKDSHNHLKKGVKEVKKNPFFKGLAFLIILQFTFFSFLEFQYTKAIEHHVEVQEQVTVASGEISETHKEDQIAKELGKLIIIFSAISLLIQLFLSSRIVEYLGIAESLPILPIMNFLSIIGMFFGFNLATAAIAKGGYEVGEVVFQGSYHTSYYTLDSSKREQLKEFIEGIIKPLGAVIATIVLFVLIALFDGSLLTLTLNILMGIIALGAIITSLRLAPLFRKSAVSQLSKQHDLETRIAGVELLGQNMNNDTVRLLTKILKRKNENSILKVKIIEVLSLSNDINILSLIIDFIDEEGEEISLAAINGVNNYKRLEKKLNKHEFAKFRLITTLKKKFYETKSDVMRKRIVKVFTKFKQDEIIDFLIKNLSSKDPMLVGDSIYICGKFHDDSVSYYLKPFLDSKNVYIRSNAMIALWGFDEYRKQILFKLNQLKLSKQAQKQIMYAYVAGEIKHKHDKDILENLLNSKDESIKLEAALALCKLHVTAANKVVADMIVHGDEESTLNIRSRIRELPYNVQENIEDAVQTKVCSKIYTVINDTKSLKKDSYNALEMLYMKIHAYDEALQIKRLSNKTK